VAVVHQTALQLGLYKLNDRGQRLMVEKLKPPYLLQESSKLLAVLNADLSNFHGLLSNRLNQRCSELVVSTYGMTEGRAGWFDV
jgi:hypothetical protein